MAKKIGEKLWNCKKITSFKVKNKVKPLTISRDLKKRDILGTQADVGWLEELEWSPALGKEPNSSPELWWADGLSSVKSPGCKYKLRDDNVVWLWSVLNRSGKENSWNQRRSQMGGKINLRVQFYIQLIYRATVSLSILHQKYILEGEQKLSTLKVS